MARVIRQTPLENYVKDYLRSTRSKTTAEKNLLLRAAEYIKLKIGAACCDPDNPIIDLHTGKESVFTKTVYTMLYGMDRNGHIQSLQRTYNAIINYVTPPCCFEDDTTFAITGPTGTVHSATDPYNLSVTVVTGGPFIDAITHVDFYVNGTLRQVILGNNGVGTFNVTNAVGSQSVNYYFIAYTDSGTNVQSATTTFTLTNP
jgi:hypothetical protein